MIRYAVDTLTALPGAAVYIDAGHSDWMPAAEIGAAAAWRPGSTRPTASR